MPDLIVHTTAGPRAGLRLRLPAGEAVAIQLDGPPHVPEGSTVIPVFQYVHAARRLDPLDTLTPGSLLGYFTGTALWLLDDDALTRVQEHMAAADTSPDRERSAAGPLAAQLYASPIFQSWVGAHSDTSARTFQPHIDRRRKEYAHLRTGAYRKR